MTTYSVDFHFYEAVVLRRLNAAGCERHVLLVDAERCGEALADPERRPRLAGISYALIPVVKDGAFHPKIVLLAGKKSSRLFVGSHNVTFAGFGGNAEITNSLEAPRSSPNTAVLADVISAVRSWVRGPAASLVTEVLGAAEALLGSAKGTAEASLLVSSAGLPSLWDQLRVRLPAKVARVIVVGPFFDERMQFIQRAIADLGADEFIVGIDPEYSKLDPDAARRTAARFVDVKACLKERGFGASSVLHAKAMIIETGVDTVLVSGSANPSAAAWLRPETNAEAVLFRERVADADPVAMSLRELADAPEISASQWAEISERVRTEREAETPDAAPALTAIELGGHITIYGAPGVPMAVRLVFADGASRMMDTILENGQLVVCGEANELSACTLVELVGEPRAFAVVNHVDILAPRAGGGGSTRADLHAALGAVSDDPSRLEEILRIVERAIEDSDVRDIEQKGRAAADTSPDDVAAAPLGSRAMKLADVKRRQGPPKSLATGDISVVIDLLIRRISDGLLPPEAAPSTREVEEQELDPLDEAARSVSAASTSHGPALVKACHRKMGTMLRRMCQRLEHAMRSGAGATRATIQLAAVLGVVRWLRRIERQLPWLPFGASLVPPIPRAQLFDWSAKCLGSPRRSLVDLVRSETPDDFEEVSVALGLASWLGRECGVDTRTLPRHPDRDDLGKFASVGNLVSILRQVAFDDTARTVLAVAISEGRGPDREEWLAVHLRLGDAAALSEVSPSDAPVLSREVRRGDLVRINMPNGTSAIGYAMDLDETKIRLLDGDDANGRPVLRRYVAPVDVDSVIGVAGL